MDWQAWDSAWGTIGLWLLLLGIVVVLFSMVWRVRGRRGRRQAPSSGANHRAQASGLTLELDLLDERYARGELTQHEYLERRQELITNRRYIA